MINIMLFRYFSVNIGHVLVVPKALQRYIDNPPEIAEGLMG